MSAAAEGAGRTAALWVGVLGPPLAWAVRIAASYLLVPYACTAGALWLLHALTLAGVAGCAAAGALAWRLLREGGPERAVFMARVGVLGALLFAAVILAEGLANALLHPCQRAGPLLP